MLIHLPVTLRPLIFPQKEAFLSSCNFATTHLTARILKFYLPLTSRPMKWRTLSQLPNYQRTPKGGTKKEGGGKTSRGDPPRKTVSDPPHLSTFCPPSPHGISLSKSLRRAQNFPQLTTSETAFGGSQKIVSDGPSSRGFAFRYVLPPPPPPPPLALPRTEDP